MKAWFIHREHRAPELLPCIALSDLNTPSHPFKVLCSQFTRCQGQAEAHLLCTIKMQDESSQKLSVVIIRNEKEFKRCICFPNGPSIKPKCTVYRCRAFRENVWVHATPALLIIMYYSLLINLMSLMASKDSYKLLPRSSHSGFHGSPEGMLIWAAADEAFRTG